jgi:hypothetical protein
MPQVVLLPEGQTVLTDSQFPGDLCLGLATMNHQLHCLALKLLVVSLLYLLLFQGLSHFTLRFRVRQIRVPVGTTLKVLHWLRISVISSKCSQGCTGAVGPGFGGDLCHADRSQRRLVQLPVSLDAAAGVSPCRSNALPASVLVSLVETPWHKAVSSKGTVADLYRISDSGCYTGRSARSLTAPL